MIYPVEIDSNRMIARLSEDAIHSYKTKTNEKRMQMEIENERELSGRESCPVSHPEYYGMGSRKFDTLASSQLSLGNLCYGQCGASASCEKISINSLRNLAINVAIASEHR